MAREVSYEEFIGDMTEDDVATLIALSKKRRIVWLVLLLVAWVVLFVVEAICNWVGYVPWVGAITLPLLGIPAALGAYTTNFIRFLQTRGEKRNGLMTFVWLFFGALVLPFIVLVILNLCGVLTGILGWEKTGIKFTRVK